MKITYINNSILSTHYTNYLNTLGLNNNKLISTNLSDSQILELYNKKYNLTEFEIYKYITAYDHAIDSLGYNKLTFNEGITSNKNKYNNILIDLFFKSIPLEVLEYYSLSIVFGIKQTIRGEIQDLTKLDKKNNKINSPYLFSSLGKGTPDFDTEYWDDDDTYSQWWKDYQDYKSEYKGYSGNSYTYFIFKQLIYTHPIREKNKKKTNKNLIIKIEPLYFILANLTLL